jgi:polar amino acid transport system permease protein
LSGRWPFLEGEGGSLDWSVISESLPDILRGTVVTVYMTFLCMTLSTLVGLWMATLTYSRLRVARVAAHVFIESGRNLPEVVVLYLVFFLTPQVGLTLPAIAAGAIGLTWVFGAFLAEVFRGGIEAVSETQWDASRALGMDRRLTWRRVILPQAARAILPVWGSYLLGMYKATALLSVITVPELFATVRHSAAISFRFFELFTAAAVVYAALGYLTVLGLRFMERRWSYAVRPVDKSVLPEAPVAQA